MINDVQMAEIAALVNEEYQRLETNQRVGNKCGVSEATISLIRNGKWESVTPKMWRHIGASLGWKDDGWNIVDITNTKILWQTFDDAKANSMWMMVSHRAGGSKTFSALAYKAQNIKDVYMVKCRVWDSREFMLRLCQELGIATGPGYASTNELVDKVTRFFNESTGRPLLILDEAHDLKATALRCLKPIFNETEGKLGVVMLGTDYLEKQISNGVRYNKQGYDELESRFGRRYIHLLGATKADISKICQANGLADKRKQSEVFEECSPERVIVDGKTIRMVQDLRRVKRVVQRELILLEA